MDIKRELVNRIPMGEGLSAARDLYWMHKDGGSDAVKTGLINMLLGRITGNINNKMYANGWSPPPSQPSWREIGQMIYGGYGQDTPPVMTLDMSGAKPMDGWTPQKMPPSLLKMMMEGQK